MAVLPRGTGSFRFGREERLKKRGQIKEVFKKGKPFGCAGAKLFVSRNGLGLNRICFTFARGFAGAVRRNRAKRLGREAYRMLKPGLKPGFDLIFLAYPERQDLRPGLAERLKQMELLFTRAGLRK
ncbi:MAG: ribonuclease P protein component [Treponema sp.]|nr:ribonuclease P protein component [Treponema sp.]